MFHKGRIGSLKLEPQQTAAYCTSLSRSQFSKHTGHPTTHIIRLDRYDPISYNSAAICQVGSFAS